MRVQGYRPGDRSGVAACIIALQDHERTIEPDRIEGRKVANLMTRLRDYW